jgi:hypothetical protein
MIFPNFLSEALNQIRGTAGEAQRQIGSNFNQISESINRNPDIAMETSDMMLPKAALIFTKDIMYPEKINEEGIKMNNTMMVQI